MNSLKDICTELFKKLTQKVTEQTYLSLGNPPEVGVDFAKYTIRIVNRTKDNGVMKVYSGSLNNNYWGKQNLLEEFKNAAYERNVKFLVAYDKDRLQNSNDENIFMKTFGENDQFEFIPLSSNKVPHFTVNDGHDGRIEKYHNTKGIKRENYFYFNDDGLSRYYNETFDSLLNGYYLEEENIPDHLEQTVR